MNYQTLKQLRDKLITEIHDSGIPEKNHLCPEDFETLLCFLDEYEELSRKMLQLIKQKEQVQLSDFSLGK